MVEAGCDIGVIGGSGLYALLDDPRQVEIDTPWGDPSEPPEVGGLGGQRAAFIPRHGRRHTIPPHRINYRANLWALRQLGVRRVVAPCAVGSLRPELSPGQVVVCDQFVNLSSGRDATYFDGPEVAHLSAADPYCAELRPLAARALREAGLDTVEGGTVAVVDGPRFGTRAESRMLAQLGCDLVNMTQYPEVALARELGMCYVTLALVTDWDAGLSGSDAVAPVTQEQIIEVMRRSTESLRSALRGLAALAPRDRVCACAVAPQPLSRLTHDQDGDG